MLRNRFPESSPNVFADDARVAVTSINAPSKWIGKLVLPGGGWCTAGLIQRDLIITAAHCVMDDEKHSLTTGNYQFYYGLINNRYQDISGTSFVWWGTTNPQDNRGSDWAIMRLTSPLGDKYGWMGVRSLDLSTIFHKGTVGLTGYGSDFMNGQTASVESNCSFTDSGNGGTVLHNCDMSRGASGAPMYHVEKDESGNDVYYVLAINVADYRDGKDQSLVGIPYAANHANIAVPASAFLPKLKEIIAGTAN